MSLSDTARRKELKLASNELVHDVCRKFDAADDLIGLKHSQVHRCCSENDESNFLNLWHVAVLERRASVPFVTRLLCKLAGGVFLRLPERFDEADALPVHVMHLAHEVGDVSAAVVDAMRDGVVHDDEAAEVETQLDELIDKAVQARAYVRAMQGKPAAELREIPAVREAR